MMDVKKRKRETLTDQLSEDEDDDGECKVSVQNINTKIKKNVSKVKRRTKHVPEPPSPPEDSNDREVSMILGHSSCNNR